MSEPLSKYARPRIDDARLARQWAVIARPRPMRATPWLALGYAVAVAVACVVTWRLARTTPPPVAARVGVTELTSNGPASTLVLADGSRVTVGQGSRLLVREVTDASTRIELVSGAVDLDVKHEPSRTFVVVAHGVCVIDTGTRFHVEYIEGSGEVRVTVLDGSVRVERPSSAPASLIAGESWTSANTTGVVGTATASASVVATTSAAVAVTDAAPDAGRAVVPLVNDAFARFSAVADRDPGEAFDVFGVAGYPHAIERATAKQLFELGDAARLSDHPVQAAEAFDALRLRYRSDPRAGLAAMQLARLREDTLHDPAGADAALRDAIALAPDATLREDAEARRVGVLQKMGDSSGCIQTRDAYLAKYPAGIHRASVEKSCGGR